MAKKKVPTTKAAARFGLAKNRPTPSEAKKAAAEATGDTTRPVGRPKVNHDLKRTTILSDPELIKQIKQIALDEDKNVYEVVNEAFRHYIKQKR